MQERTHPDKKPAPSTALKGWREIAGFLGEPVTVAQRWATEGMPVRREGRFVSTSREELNAWLGKESGKPVHIATENTDLSAELKRGLSFIRGEKSLPHKSRPFGERRNVFRNKLRSTDSA